jgi:hypothetical protein
MNTTHDDKTLSTADFAAAADRREQAPQRVAPGEPDMREIRDERELQGAREDGGRYEQMREPGGHAGGAATTGVQDERLAPLFLPQMAQNFKERWDEVQIGFVDDPTQAVRRADELVAQVMKNLAETFAEERANLESQMDQGDTEQLRVALRRYRSFFQRLLSL